jgi:multidrug efflux pump subunit AcrB
MKYLINYLLLCLTLLTASCASTPAVPRRSDVRVVTVTVTWPGGTPEAAVAKLAAPIEKELRSLQEISRIITECDAEGCLLILEHDSRVSSFDLQFKVNAILGQLRRTLPAEAGVTIRAFDPQRPPDISLAMVLRTPTLTSAHYQVALDYAIGLMQLPDTVQFRIRGMPKQTIRVMPDPEKLKRLGMTQDDIARAVDEQTLTIDDYRRVIIGPEPGQTGELAHVVVKPGPKTSVRLQDVAEIRVEDAPAAQFRINGEPAILIDLFLRSDAKANEVTTCFERVMRQKRPVEAKRLIPLAVRSY